VRLTALWLLTNLGFLFFWPTKWPQYILALTVPAALGAAFWLAGAWPRWRSRRRATPAERKVLRRALSQVFTWEHLAQAATEPRGGRNTFPSPPAPPRESSKLPLRTFSFPLGTRAVQP